MSARPLRSRLTRFDGKDTGVLEAICAGTPCSESLLAELVDAGRDDEAIVRIGATWLLRAYRFATFLRRCLASGNTFVRAWAPDAFHRLALRHPRFRVEANDTLRRALADPAASVGARARRIAAEA